MRYKEWGSFSAICDRCGTQGPIGEDHRYNARDAAIRAGWTIRKNAVDDDVFICADCARATGGHAKGNRS